MVVCVDLLHLNLLLLFRDKLDLSSYEHSLYWAAFCIAFLVFLRAGELSVTPTASRSDCLQFRIYLSAVSRSLTLSDCS